MQNCNNGNEGSIGVFDSGLGGLTTVSELKRIMPNESIVYLGDTGRVPYGTKSPDTIRKYTKQDITFLLSQNVKMVICACNTASTVITEEITNSLNVPLCEVLSPAVAKAASRTKTGKVGVICTSATLKSAAYEKALHKIDESIEVITIACPLFVPLVENGYTNFDNAVTRMVAEEYLTPIKAKNVDTLILGCTHYPIIKDIIADIMGKSVVLINSGAEVAEVAYEILKESKAFNLSKNKGECRYFVSDDPADFQSNAAKILHDGNGKGNDFPFKIENAVKIDIG